MPRILKYAALALSMSTPVYAATYTASFTSDGPLTAPYDYTFGIWRESFTFDVASILNANFSGYQSNDFGDIHTNYSIRTDDFGNISNISYTYREDFSEEYLSIGLMDITYDFVDGNTYTGTGNWSLSAVPLPASGLLLAFSVMLLGFRKQQTK